MKIRSFDVKAVKVPMCEPHKTASATITICPLVALSVYTKDGVRGDAVIFTYSDLFLKPTHDLASIIAPMLEGIELDPIANAAMLYDRFRLLGTQGLMGMVLSGIDMALWDARARAADQSLSDLIGSEKRPIKPYGNVGFDGEIGSATGAERLATQGFKGVKAKIGYETVDEDLTVIRAMRSAVGPKVALMVDYNQSLTQLEARHRLERLKDEDLTWVEEPIYSHDFKELHELQEETTIQLQAGENWWGPSDFQTAIDLNACTLMMPDAQKCGGVTGWLEIAGKAQNAGVKLSSHLWPEVSAQLLSITPTADWLEYADWFNPVVSEPLKIENGFAIIDCTTGTGLQLDDDAVARFAA